jgi:hypothetical protein
MSDFSLKSSGPGRVSSFQKLTSGSVNSSSSGGKAAESPRAGQTKEGEVPVSDDAATRSIFNRLSGLEASVSNLRESKGTLDALVGDDEVAREIVAASTASVRDVEVAANLASELRSQMFENKELAKDAQLTSELTPERVQKALR